MYLFGGISIFFSLFDFLLYHLSLLPVLFQIFLFLLELSVSRLHLNFVSSSVNVSLLISSETCLSKYHLAVLYHHSEWCVTESYMYLYNILVCTKGFLPSSISMCTSLKYLRALAVIFIQCYILYSGEDLFLYKLLYHL